MKSGWALAAILSLALLNGCSSSTTPVSGSGILWVATQGDQMVRTFSVNEGTGQGTAVGHGIASGAQPSAMAMTPDRKILFVANVDDSCSTNPVTYCNRVRAFSVNQSDGSLSALGSPLQIGGAYSTPQGMQMGLSVDPTGALLFVTNEGNAGVLGQSGTVAGTVSILAISSSGLPAQDNPFPSADPGDITGNGPSAVVAAPAGNFVYVVNQFTNTITAFSYGSNGQSLNFLAAYSVGTNPAALAFSRCAAGKSGNSACATADSASLFVANSGASNNISVFNACIQVTPSCPAADGTLQEISGSPFAAQGLGPTSIIVDSQIDFVYVVNKLSNDIAQFRYGANSGALTPLTPATISTGSSPVSGGITSDGTMVLVPDNGGSEVAAYVVGTQTSSTGNPPSGKLTRASTPSISLTAQPSAVIVR